MDETYAEGFKQGYRAIRGNAVNAPAAPAGGAGNGRTAFQIGLMNGIEHAKGWPAGRLLQNN